MRTVANLTEQQLAGLAAAQGFQQARLPQGSSPTAAVQAQQWMWEEIAKRQLGPDAALGAVPDGDALQVTLDSCRLDFWQQTPSFRRISCSSQPVVLPLPFPLAIQGPLPSAGTWMASSASVLEGHTTGPHCQALPAPALQVPANHVFRPFEVRNGSARTSPLHVNWPCEACRNTKVSLTSRAPVMMCRPHTRGSAFVKAAVLCLGLLGSRTRGCQGPLGRMMRAAS